MDEEGKNNGKNYQSAITQIIRHHYGWIQRCKIQRCNWLFIKSRFCLQNLQFFQNK